MSQGTWHWPIELLVFEQSIQNATRPNDKCLEKSLLSPNETEKQDEQIFWNLTTHQIKIKFSGKSVGPQKLFCLTLKRFFFQVQHVPENNSNVG